MKGMTKNEEDIHNTDNMNPDSYGNQ